MIKTKNKMKNVIKTKLLTKLGLIDNSSDFMIKEALVKASIKKLQNQLGSQSQAVLNQLKKGEDLPPNIIKSLCRYFLIEDFSITDHDRWLIQEYAVTIEQLLEEKYQVAKEVLIDYVRRGYFK